MTWGLGIQVRNLEQDHVATTKYFLAPGIFWLKANGGDASGYGTSEKWKGQNHRAILSILGRSSSHLTVGHSGIQAPLLSTCEAKGCLDQRCSALASSTENVKHFGSRYSNAGSLASFGRGAPPLSPVYCTLAALLEAIET